MQKTQVLQFTKSDKPDAGRAVYYDVALQSGDQTVADFIQALSKERPKKEWGMLYIQTEPGKHANWPYEIAKRMNVPMHTSGLRITRIQAAVTFERVDYTIWTECGQEPDENKPAWTSSPDRVRDAPGLFLSRKLDTPDGRTYQAVRMERLNQGYWLYATACACLADYADTRAGSLKLDGMAYHAGCDSFSDYAAERLGGLEGERYDMALAEELLAYLIGEGRCCLMYAKKPDMDVIANRMDGTDLDGLMSRYGGNI